jgi:hypothetical protein
MRCLQGGWILPGVEQPAGSQGSGRRAKPFEVSLVPGCGSTEATARELCLIAVRGQGTIVGEVGGELSGRVGMAET